ncbi:MAG TPA: hypothetical protein VJN21_00490 [Candidatus Acidoferrales bacterium]|nr:hypothetical protein [Candidatus Acidoferrales bacterium]
MNEDLVPAADEIVSLRIQGVTPDHIAGLRSRGMTDLTVDQFISLRIQGID